MNNSLLNGTKWRWRQGRKEIPIHADHSDSFCRTSELYTSVQNTTQAQAMIKELKDNGIITDIKRTHSPYDPIPQGSLIVFASKSQAFTTITEQKNIKKLKDYILKNGGQLDEHPSKTSVLRNFMKSIFGGR